MFVRQELFRPTVVYPHFVNIQNDTQQLSTLTMLLSLSQTPSGELTIGPDNNIEDSFKICIDELTEIGLAALVVGTIKSSLEISECNKIYSEDGSMKAPGFKSVQRAQDQKEFRGTEPYFAPNGWMRRALNIGLSKYDFQKIFSEWPILYHGTRQQFVGAILLNGLRTSIGPQCYLPKGQLGLYLSPSIEYSGNHIYAMPEQQGSEWIQVVFQVRINPHVLATAYPGTIKGAYPSLPDADKENARCDPNFSNEELEWLVQPPPGKLFRYFRPQHGIVVTGLMIRLTENHPRMLPQCAWWGRKESETTKLNSTDTNEKEGVRVVTEEQTIKPLVTEVQVRDLEDDEVSENASMAEDEEQSEMKREQTGKFSEDNNNNEEEEESEKSIGDKESNEDEKDSAEENDEVDEVNEGDDQDLQDEEEEDMKTQESASSEESEVEEQQIQDVNDNGEEDGEHTVLDEPETKTKSNLIVTKSNHSARNSENDQSTSCVLL